MSWIVLDEGVLFCVVMLICRMVGVDAGLKNCKDVMLLARTVVVPERALVICLDVVFSE